MRIENLSAGYGKKAVIRDISLEIKKGEIISLIGPNGGGKSTLLKTIIAELKPLKGAVFIERDDVRDIPIKELSRSMSIVNTDRVKPEHMSGMDVVLSGRLPYSDGLGRFSDADRQAASDSADLMHVTDLAEKPFMDLSDGQKQRILIARAICQEPEYLIMDEPTSYLDIRYRYELMDVLRNLKEKGVTVIMSLHELELALMISDRLLLVDSSGGVSCKSPEEVMESKVLKTLYDMTDDMYHKVLGQLNAPEDHTRKHCSYFVNRKCEYYPCHDVPEDKFSCLFCYCPLYGVDDCGGNYRYSEKGIKNCKDCSFPHDSDNYPQVIKKLKENMYGEAKHR